MSWSLRIRQAARHALVGSLVTGGLGQAVLVVSGVVAARVLGVENRGHLALMTLLPAVLTQVGSLGLPSAVTYFVSSDPRQLRAVRSTIVRLAGPQLVAVALLQAAIVLAIFHDEGRSPLVAALITVPMSTASLLHQYGLAFLQGLQRFRWFNILRLLPAASYSVMLLLMWLLQRGDLVLVAVLWTGTGVTTALLTLAVARRSIRAHATSEATADARPGASRLVRFGLSSVLGAVSPAETFRVDQAAVGLWLSPAALGVYVVGLAFTNLPRFLAQSIGLVAYPQVAAEPDRARARALAWRYFLVSAAVAGGVALSLALLMGWLVATFFGAEFAEATSLGRILLLGAFCFGIRRTLSDGMRGLGHPSAGTIAELASWCWLLPALPLLGGGWGVNGVAVAQASAAVFGLGWLLVLFMRTSRRPRVPAPVGVAAAGDRA